MSPVLQTDPPNHPDAIRWVDTHAGAVPEAVPGRMFGTIAWYAGGRAFACVVGEGAAVKLGASAAAQAQIPGFEPFMPYGKGPMTGWVYITLTALPGAGALFAEAARTAAAAPRPKRAARPRRPPFGRSA